MEQITKKKYKVFMFYAGRYQGEHGTKERADELETLFNQGWRIDKEQSLGVTSMMRDGIEESVPVHMFILARDEVVLDEPVVVAHERA